MRDRDLGGAVLEAQRKVAEQVALPPGSRLEWVGEFGDLQDALERLEIVVPLSIALILLLLFVNFRSLVDTLLAASVMPMALIGGIFALCLTGTPFSVSAAIGFVGLFGISVMEGIIVLSYFNTSDRCRRRTLRSGHPGLSDTDASGHDDLHRRLRRPAAGGGSTGIGSQVQKPLALVVVGGIFLAPVLILIVMPVLIDLFSRRRAPVEVPRQLPAPAE